MTGSGSFSTAAPQTRLLAEAVRLAVWEWFRLRRRVDFLVIVGASLVIPVLALGFTGFQHSDRMTTLFDTGYLEVAGGALSFISPLLAIILAGLVHAADLQNGNVRTLVARGAPRSMILASKALTAATVLAGLHLAVCLTAFAFSALLIPQFSGWDEGLKGIGASYLNSLLYLALGMALAHWRQSTSFTLGIGIPFIFLESIAYPIANGIGQSFGWPIDEVTRWTIWGVTRGLEGQSQLMDGVWFIPIVIGYLAILVGLALAAFTRFDLRSGGE